MHRHEDSKTKGEIMAIDYHNIITLEPGKRSGKPCIRGLRITVYDVLSWLAEGMSREEIIDDFPELNDKTLPRVYWLQQAGKGIHWLSVSAKALIKTKSVICPGLPAFCK